MVMKFVKGRRTRRMLLALMLTTYGQADNNPNEGFDV